MERTREPENQRANIDYRTDIDNLIERMARNSKTGIWKRNRRRAPVFVALLAVVAIVGWVLWRNYQRAEKRFNVLLGVCNVNI